MTKEDRNRKKVDIEEYEKIGVPEDELTICKNCDCVVPEYFIGESELALQDHVCRDCMENGYGR